jgi:molybdopterin converting factor small subunit
LEITIKFYNGLDKFIKNYDTKRGIVLNLSESININFLISQLLPKEIIKSTGIVMVNKKIEDFSYKIKKGDFIEVFPLLGGG